MGGTVALRSVNKILSGELISAANKGYKELFRLDIHWTQNIKAIHLYF